MFNQASISIGSQTRRIKYSCVVKVVDCHFRFTTRQNTIALNRCTPNKHQTSVDLSHILKTFQLSRHFRIVPFILITLNIENGRLVEKYNLFVLISSWYQTLKPVLTPVNNHIKNMLAT